MRENDSLPSYEQLFGELDSRADDNSRSVYSPAAYLADLLRLVEDNFADPSLLKRRPGLREIPLDAGHTHTETPYLDIVNEILEGLVGEDPYETLRTLRFPFDMPFSLQHERLRAHLRHLGVAPDELYRMFADPARGDVVAREYLGLSPEDVEMVTTPRGTGPDVLACYSADPGVTVADLCDVDRFSRATGLTAAGLRELLFQRLDPRNPAASRFFIHQGGVRVTVDAEGKRLLWGDGPDPIPPEWFDRVNRFARLARMTGLSFTDLDLVLRTCCGNRIDLAALRVIAVVIHLGRVCDLPIDVVCALAAPMDTLGFGDEARQDLFSRTFNPVPPPGAGQTPPISPDPDTAGAEAATCAGDILAAHNAAFRARVARCLAMPESDIAETVTRFRRRYSVTPLEQGPFDQRAFGLHALSLLHRVARLTGALGLPAAELFDVLEAIESDSSLRAYTTFRILIGPSIDTDAHDPDCYRMLEAADSGSALWLAQTLHATVRWMQGTGIGGRELLEILGGPAGRGEDGEERLLGLLTTLCREIEPVTAGPDMFVSARFSQRSSRVIHDVLATHPGAVVSARGHLDAGGTLVTDPLPADGLSDDERAEVYDNLLFHGYLDPSGTVLRPDVFADSGGAAAFRVNADIDHVAPARCSPSSGTGPFWCPIPRRSSICWTPTGCRPRRCAPTGGPASRSRCRTRGRVWRTTACSSRATTTTATWRTAVRRGSCWAGTATPR